MFLAQQYCLGNLYLHYSSTTRHCADARVGLAVHAGIVHSLPQSRRRVQAKYKIESRISPIIRLEDYFASNAIYYEVNCMIYAECFLSLFNLLHFRQL